MNPSRRSPPLAAFQADIVAHNIRSPPLAAFQADIVAHHIRPSLSGDVSGRFRCPAHPAVPLRRRFGVFPLPSTSGHPSPATFPALNDSVDLLVGSVPDCKVRQRHDDRTRQDQLHQLRTAGRQRRRQRRRQRGSRSGSWSEAGADVLEDGIFGHRLRYGADHALRNFLAEKTE